MAVIRSSTRGSGRRLPLLHLLGLFLLMAPVAHAQDVRWERVGEPFSGQGLDVADNGTLYAAGSAGLLRLTPEDTWEVLYDDYVRSVAVLGAGDTLVVEESYILRSTDGGQTWTEVYDKNGPLTRLSDGTLFSGRSGFYTGFTVRSDDGGATWEAPDFSGEPPFHCEAFGEAGANVMAGCVFGVAYSTDGGHTFAPSSLWDTVYGGRSFAQLGDGTALAIVGGGCCYGGIYRSTDGGRTWDFLFDIEGPGTLAASGQTVFAVRGDSRVWRSTDGGQAWEEVASFHEGEPFMWANDAAVGPDGRLYAAGSVGGPPAAPSGVYRTVDPVFPPVAAETGPPRRASARLEVYPNPAGESITVALELAEAGHVRIGLYDVQGREVAVLHAGPLSAGEHALSFESAHLPAGVYLVRVEGKDLTASQRVTVVR